MSIEKRLQAAGLLGLPFSWGGDGAVQFGANISPANKAAVQAVFDGYTPAQQRQDLNFTLTESVDDCISAIYERFTRFETEYLQREGAARAFKAAGYQGDAGVWVMAFATNTGMSAHAAADLIIGQADGMRAALVTLGALRMRKYAITGAATAAAAQAVHDDIVGQAMQIAAGL